MMSNFSRSFRICLSSRGSEFDILQNIQDLQITKKMPDCGVTSEVAEEITEMPMESLSTVVGDPCLLLLTTYLV